MAGLSNGMALHGGIQPYAGTFLIFSDYLRPSLRLSALMEQPVVYVFTHDSIGLGEDGPTHQPVEHLMALRAIPGATLIRPADANEAARAWAAAVTRTDGPTALALTRQTLPVVDRTELTTAEGLRRGAYILREAAGQPGVILMGTGSEVQHALQAARDLEAEGIGARVVSMPSWPVSAAPVSFAPETTCMTDSGTPASKHSSASRYADSGVVGAGFTTVVLPAASAGATPRAKRFPGKFHGMTWAETPYGSRTV
jgi:transketolase